MVFSLGGIDHVIEPFDFLIRFFIGRGLVKKNCELIASTRKKKIGLCEGESDYCEELAVFIRTRTTVKCLEVVSL